MVSNTCKYAIRAVVFISMNANGKHKTDLKQISDELNIPYSFLGKILQTLTKYKLLNSWRGPKGGFQLARPADEISVLDIIEIIDGKDLFEKCFFGFTICSNKHPGKKPCPVHHKTVALRTELYRLFKNQTIGELASVMKANDIHSF